MTRRASRARAAPWLKEAGTRSSRMADNVNRLLIVDEEHEVADFVAGVAKNVGYAVACAPSGASFVLSSAAGIGFASVPHIVSRWLTPSS